MGECAACDGVVRSVLMLRASGRTSDSYGGHPAREDAIGWLESEVAYLKAIKSELGGDPLHPHSPRSQPVGRADASASEAFRVRSLHKEYERAPTEIAAADVFDGPAVRPARVVCLCTVRGRPTVFLFSRRACKPSFNLAANS